MLSDQFLLEMRLDRTRIPSFDAYPFSLNAVKNLDALPLHRAVTFIIGENGSGFYILDEPEAALSPTRQMSALVRIHQLVQQGAQFVISTHSPILMAYPEAWIYSLDAGGIERIAYEDTEHYQVTRDFLNNHQIMLNVLLAD